MYLFVVYLHSTVVASSCSSQEPNYNGGPFKIVCYWWINIDLLRLAFYSVVFGGFFQSWRIQKNYNESQVNSTEDLDWLK